MSAISFGLALLLAVIGLANILFPDPIRIGAWRPTRIGTVADEATILQYIGGCIQGVGLTCIGIICAIIGNTSANLAITLKRT